MNLSEGDAKQLPLRDGRLPLAESNPSANRLQPTLNLVDAIALTVGVVIGAGIFETPAFVAGEAGSVPALILLWLAGGGISLIGALCYAELATTYPHPGGNYHYLRMAMGKNVAFLFSWARMTVMQPGSIVLIAFVLGDYATQILSLGSYSASIYAALAIVLFTGLNLLGVHPGKWVQRGLTVMEVLGLLLVVIVGLTIDAPDVPATAIAPEASGNLGLAMVLVLLSYGGWNEAAYISAELRNVKRNMIRSLMWSIGIISGVYVLINLAYLHGLGLAGMVQSQAVASDLLRQAIGEPGARWISLLIVIATLGSLNATVFTGARTNYALGRDFPSFAKLGRWHVQAHTPTQALWVQGAISLALVGLGSLNRSGFKTMVDFTSPIFWLFFLLTGIALLILRRKHPQQERPFRVPFYPLIPVLFCLVCGYMLYSSLAYTGTGAIVGGAILMLGLPVLLVMRRMEETVTNHS
ncbi:APC family permease [Leptolyngbya ohadii]|uniref:APC family permease n=1 Tax=Leptolyngbya ohadii TaxID=1962290 RepID=UPI000B59F8AC|nr:amino acid permease [Leptolyngbya ohadii]